MGKKMKEKTFGARSQCVLPAPTAAAKKFAFGLDPRNGKSDWTKKRVKTWQPIDVMYWLQSVAKSNNVPYEALYMHRFNVRGSNLLALTEADFVTRDADYGSLLYASLQVVKERERKQHEIRIREAEDEGKARREREMEGQLHPLVVGKLHAMHLSETGVEGRLQESAQAIKVEKKEDATAIVDLPKKRRGRPPGSFSSKVTKKEKTPKTSCLWKFLLMLLNTPEHSPGVIEWEDRTTGLFRITDSSALAQLWGRARGNTNMDYVKLSRLMRYYYKNKELQAEKQRLVYRFGPNAQGWQTHVG